MLLGMLLKRHGCMYFPPCPTSTSPLSTSRTRDLSKATFSSNIWSSNAPDMILILSSCIVVNVLSRCWLRRFRLGLECFLGSLESQGNQMGSFLSRVGCAQTLGFVIHGSSRTRCSEGINLRLTSEALAALGPIRRLSLSNRTARPKPHQKYNCAIHEKRVCLA